MKIWAIISTGVALVLLELLLRTVSAPSSGGEDIMSPDGKFVAHALSLKNENPLASSKTYYEFTLSHGHGVQPFKRIVMYPSEQHGSMYFRELPNIIVWSTNSDEVTFSIPGMTLKLDVRDYHQEQ